jgi:recombination protein RecT
VAEQKGQELDLAMVGRKTRTLVETYRSQFAAVVPKHVDPEAFIELAVAYVKSDRSGFLQRATVANPASLVLALRECAAKGHMPMKGIYSLVPFPDRKATGGWAVTGVEEWRGVIERMYRAGGVTSVHVVVARDGDKIRWNPTRMTLPDHEYDEFAAPAERGPLKAVYAYARMLSGAFSAVAFLNRHEVARHRAMSKSIRAEGGGNFWGPEWPAEGPNTEAMWRKTALHALEGLVPMSAEYRWQLAASEAGARDWPALPDRPVTPAYTGGDEPVDAEIVPDGEWPAVAQPADGR